MGISFIRLCFLVKFLLLTNHFASVIEGRYNLLGHPFRRIKVFKEPINATSLNEPLHSDAILLILAHWEEKWEETF